MRQKQHILVNNNPSYGDVFQRFGSCTDRFTPAFERTDSGRVHWLLYLRARGDDSTKVDQAVGSDDSFEVRRRRLEAVLLISREPLSSRKLGQLAGLADATEARTLTRQLNELYDRQGRAMRVEEIAGGFQLLSRPQFARWLRRLAHVPDEQRWTQSSMETLALVAYRQPILRADLEAIRGVGCGEVLRQLLQRDLVRICGRSEELGKPYLYGTTKRFLQLFGISSVNRLPRVDWVKAAELQLAERSTDDGSNSITFLDKLRGQVGSEK